MAEEVNPVTTAVLDPGGLARTIFVILVIMVESYYLRKLIMATKEELKAAIDDLTSSISGEIERVTTQIAKLQAQAGTDDGVSPADLDEPVASLKALKVAVDGVSVDSSGTPQMPPIADAPTTTTQGS